TELFRSPEFQPLRQQAPSESTGQEHTGAGLPSAAYGARGCADYSCEGSGGELYNPFIVEHHQSRERTGSSELSKIEPRGLGKRPGSRSHSPFKEEWRLIDATHSLPQEHGEPVNGVVDVHG